MGADRGPAAFADELITFGEVRSALGVAKSRAWTITRDRAFPAPWFVSADNQIRLWLRADVETWLDANRQGWRGTPTG